MTPVGVTAGPVPVVSGHPGQALPRTAIRGAEGARAGIHDHRGCRDPLTKVFMGFGSRRLRRPRIRSGTRLGRNDTMGYGAGPHASRSEPVLG